MSGSSWGCTWERPRLQTSSLQLVLDVVVLVVDVLGVVDGVVVVVVIGVDVRIEDVDHTAALELDPQGDHIEEVIVHVEVQLLVVVVRRMRVDLVPAVLAELRDLLGVGVVIGDVRFAPGVQEST